ncbi:hypothetical protein PMIN03_004637 [Paraphaeosphaeria minitans]
MTKWTGLCINAPGLAQDEVNKTALRTDRSAPRVAKMRLRLSVQRNNLPVSNILWSVPDTASAQAYTFARLLEDVDRILPLEAEQWGLEDYIVELEGFECLHFSPVLLTLKEDDRLSIRPLLTAEVRSRTLCGRTQITDDGRHLVDGIPFGRPFLRQPLRPAVTIPPRKRLRLDEDTVAGTDAPESTGVSAAAIEAQAPVGSTGAKKKKKEVQFSQAVDEGSEDSEDDEDFVLGHVSEGSVNSDSDDDTSSAASEPSAQASKSNERRRSPEHEASDTSSASATDASSDSSSESDTSQANPKAEASADSDSESDSDSDSTDSDSDSDSASSSPEVLSSKPPVPPWSGSKDTRRRNFRRKQLIKLKRLKAEGKLHHDATYADLQDYLGIRKQPSPLTPTPAHTMSKSTGKRKRLGEDAEDQNTQTQADESAELERRREELMARLADTATDVEMTPVESWSSIGEQTEQTVSVSASPAMPDAFSSKGGAATPTPPTKRLRPNVSAIGRILQRQAVNIERKIKPMKPPVADPEPEGASDTDFWKSGISLSAFECWDEEHELSAPPFPFKQHWDPASKLMREKKQAKQKKKARESEQATELLVYDNEDQEPEDTPVLDYGDSPKTMKAASDPTDAAESQILQEVELAAKSDLPALPEDVETLPTLQPHDVQVGAVVVFKVYAIDPVTVTPHISEYKTATVEKEGDSGHGAGTFRLKLANRDIPAKASERLDERGHSVKNAVSGFRMNDEDEDEDDGVWEGMFGELVEPKLLKAAV